MTVTFPKVCRWCGGPFRLEVAEVWGCREFVLNGCCESTHDEAVEWLQHPDDGARLLRSLGIDDLVPGRGGLRRIANDDLRLSLEWNSDDFSLLSGRLNRHPNFISRDHGRRVPDQGMIWRWSNRADHRARLIADRHYNRQKIGTKQFVPPGRCLVLYAATRSGEAIWVTSWPYAQYVKHAWAGAWVCSAFRNEGAGVASEMILQAIAATRHFYGDPPALGMITFVDESKVKPTRVRGKDVWGWSYRKAGFIEAGRTVGGLLALQLLPETMPAPQSALTDLEACAEFENVA